MLRFTEIRDAGAASSYYGKTDGGYYLDAAELWREVGGKFGRQLGLSEKPDYEQFTRLLNGLDPFTGERLTQRLVNDRVAAWDLTASLPKGVTEAIEGGDARVAELVRETLRKSLEEVEERVTTRVRKGGRQEDRVSGNLCWFAFEHPETRPTSSDNMPRPDRHIHVVIPSLTFDFVEQQIKAIKWRPTVELRKWFSTRFDLRLSHGLAELGYEIKTEYRPDSHGGMKYYSFDIAGMPESMIAWDSQRHKEIEERAKELGKTSPLEMARMGATSRLAKRKDLSLADCRAYWDSCRTSEELEGRAECIRRAMEGDNPNPEPGAGEAARYAIDHQFYRNSVVRYTDLEVAAMERMMGRGRPEELLPQFERQGLLLKEGQATTEQVLAQERRIVAFASETRGSMAPLGLGSRQPDLTGMANDQRAAIRHILQSPDQVLLIRGGAGTGKTTMMQRAIAGTGKPVVVLAPSADASRGELRSQGFGDANTVTAFLDRPEMQQQVRGGGVIWCDEAGLLPIADLERLCGIAKELDAKLILQGDDRQHKAVSRHGNMLNVLHDYAGLPVAELKEIKRQKGDYAVAVAAIRDGQWEKADNLLRKLGWVVESEGHAALVEEYARAIKERKAVTVDGKLQMVPKSIIVVNPTHRDGDGLSEQLRALRKAEGLIDQEDRAFARLVPLSWTDAEKADSRRYAGDEVVQFFKNTGPFKAGQRVRASELLPALEKVKPEYFQVYSEQQIRLAKGDSIRLTAGGKTKDGHRVDNGRIDEIAGFTAAGDIVLRSNGWVLAKDFSHWRIGLLSTSYASQSKTQEIVLTAMNRASLGAMGAEQAYVSLSRGRERGMIFTDLGREELLDAMSRSDLRRSATELMGAPPARRQGKVKDRERSFAARMRAQYRHRRERERTPEVKAVSRTVRPNREERDVTIER
jgi:conjugative relaxase-like TrwC/TraI family protein